MKILTWALGVTLFFAGIVHAEDIYVSPSGDDASAGTKDKPIRTIEHARDLVRARNQNMSGDITVYLDGGQYRVAQPLVLEAADSGMNNHDVIYAAIPGQQVIISGGIQVTGWKQTDASKNLWSAPLPAGLKYTRQLYVDGVRAQRAGDLLPVALTEQRNGPAYTAASDLMTPWRNPSEI